MGSSALWGHARAIGTEARTSPLRALARPLRNLGLTAPGGHVTHSDPLHTLALDEDIWGAFFAVHSLVLVGTLEPDGGHDVAPKHLAMPMSWGPFFGFVCTPEHRTWRNVERTGVFTVSYPGPDQAVAAALAASPRDPVGDKPSLAALPVEPARTVDGVLVSGCPVYLECELERTVPDLGPNGLLIGRVVAAHVLESALRDPERDDADLIFDRGLLAYLHPFRFADLRESRAFPLPEGFCR
jgi:flavin reductase (DIM6/NTAB) family NADH-FMN oxidoreductase RutF